MKDMYFGYVLRSRVTDRHYTGSCENLDDRLRRRNNGESKATKHGIPWELVYSETHPTHGLAMERERFFKMGSGREELKRTLAAQPG
jgi:putative endonuclease